MQSGLDVTLLVFIIIISVLILGLIILLLVYWFCRPNRGEQDTQHQVGVYKTDILIYQCCP